MNDDLQALIEAQKADVHQPPTHKVAQWHDAIDQAAALERGRRTEPAASWHPRSFFWGMAVTAALAIGIAIGVMLSGGNETHTMEALVVDVSPESQTTPAGFTRGLAMHLRDSRQQLVTFDDAGDRTSLVLDIIRQNRMFETAAERNNAPKVARVLRAFEPILLQLAADDIAPEDAEALRAQLAFELNVMLTKLASDTSDESHTT